MSHNHNRISCSLVPPCESFWRQSNDAALLVHQWFISHSSWWCNVTQYPKVEGATTHCFHCSQNRGSVNTATHAMEPHRLFVFPVDRVKHSPRQLPQGGLDWGAKTAEPHKWQVIVPVLSCVYLLTGAHLMVGLKLAIITMLLKLATFQFRDSKLLSIH